MFGHVSAERLWDAVESAGSLDSDERAHVERCGACASRLDEARGGLLALRTVREEEMEPPAAYWESLRGDIRRRVSTPVSSVRPSWRPAWALVVASAAVVVAVLALTASPRWANSVQRADVRVWTALPSADDDASLDLVQAAVDELDEVSTDELGVSPALVAALEDMNDDEALSLARAMIEDGTEKGRL